MQTVGKIYEVIDTSNGGKLERWGDYILVRPDPRVIWNTPHKERVGEAKERTLSQSWR